MELSLAIKQPVGYQRVQVRMKIEIFAEGVYRHHHGWNAVYRAVARTAVPPAAVLHGRPLGEWGETHSASRLNDYQCRRLDLRYRDADGKIHFAWSLNNTVIASPRVLIPLLEMHQQQDGSVAIPEPLRVHCGGATHVR